MGYFKSECSNSLKIYIFGMCKLIGIIWCIIYANRMLLKIWPHLTFGWPFVNISLTIHPTHCKLNSFSKVIWSSLKVWPPPDLCVTPTGKGPNRPKCCQNIFCSITTSKLSITHFRQNGTWVLFPLHLNLHSISQNHSIPIHWFLKYNIVLHK